MSKFRKEIMLGVVFLLLCGLSAFGVTFMFSHEEGTKSPRTVRSDETAFGAGYIEVNVHVTNIDPVASHLNVELEFVPHGKFDEGDGFLAVPIILMVDSTSESHIEFSAGEKMRPVELTFDFDEGEASAYPFDEYKTILEVRLAEQTSPASELVNIPTELSVYAFHHNYELDAKSKPIDSHGDMTFDIHVQRSALVRGTAIFWMIIIWGLTIVNLALFIGVLRGYVKPDFSLFGYMSGFIVAIYFFRQMFPDIPNFLGVFADFASILWAILVAAGIAIVVAIKWLITIFNNEDGEADSIG